MNAKPWVSALLLAHVFTACKGDSATENEPTPAPPPATRPTNPTYDFGGNAQVRPEAVVLPPEATDHVVVSETKLVFPRAGNEWLLTASVGTPLVGGRRSSVFASNNALGILRKIRSTSADATTITVETDLATLPDVITGDFEMGTPDGVVTPVSPAGLDFDALYFSDWAGNLLEHCNDEGICVLPPDRGDGPPAFANAAATPYKPVLLPPLASETPFPVVANTTESLEAQMVAAGPERVESLLTDLIASASKIRDVRVKGLGAYSDAELKKIMAVAAHNLEEEGNAEAAEGMRELSAIVLAPEFPGLSAAAARPDGAVSPGVQPQLWGWVKSTFTKVVKVIVAPLKMLLSVDKTLSLATFGRQKNNPWGLTFIDIKDKEKKVGQTVLTLSAKAEAEAHAYLATKARIKGSIVGGVDFSAWLEGEIGAGAKVAAEVEVALKSAPTDEDAKALAKIPEKSKTPWQRRLVSLPPFAGPNIGPVPTTFRVNFDLKCDWEIKAKIEAELDASVKATAKLGARYQSGRGWSKINDFEWEKNFASELTLGGGLQVRCGVEPSVAWLIADVAGPHATAFGGLKGSLTYEESCEKAKTTSPDAKVELALSAFIELGLGGKAQFLGIDLAQIGPLVLFEKEWPLISKEWDFEGGGFGYCSEKCGTFGLACCTSSAKCETGLTCDGLANKCKCSSGISCGDACCGAGEICSNDKCEVPAIACDQFKQMPSIVNFAGCEAKGNCPTSCKTAAGPSGYYLIKPNASKPAFQVLCDKTLDGGGWTLVGYEPKGDPNPGDTTGIMAQLAKESAGVDPVALSTATKAGFLGPRFSFPSNYGEARLNWCADASSMKYQRFTTTADLFADTVANAPNTSSTGEPLSGPNQMLRLENFSSNDAALNALLQHPDDAGFCRAYAGSLIPGDTSWAVKQRAEASNACGCNSGGWQGTGSYYGGKGLSGNNDGCTPQGGGWSGTAANGALKGGINTHEFYFWIR